MAAPSTVLRAARPSLKAPATIVSRGLASCARNALSLSRASVAPTVARVHTAPRARGVATSARSLPTFSVANKVCVLTGAARGLGYTMAEALVQSGASKGVILDLRAEDAQRAADELNALVGEGGQFVGLSCDVSSEASVKEAFGAIKDKFGGVDVLVTAAGIVENYSALDYPIDRVRKLLDINVMGTYLCALEAARLMPNGGSVVMIGSMSGSVVNVPQLQTPYNFSKAAVRHMGRSLAVEWAKDNIRVNVIAPGYMMTNLTKVILDNDPALNEAWLSRIPVGRMGNPEDLKGAVVYLASDASAYTTGAELTVDGAYTCI